MTRGNETGAGLRGENGDGWVTGAWSTEGWMSATAPRRPPPAEEESARAGGLDDDAVTGELPVVDAVPVVSHTEKDEVAQPSEVPRAADVLPSAAPSASPSASPPTDSLPVVPAVTPDPSPVALAPSPPPNAGPGAPPRTSGRSDRVSGPPATPSGQRPPGRGPTDSARPSAGVVAHPAIPDPAPGGPVWIDPAEVGPAGGRLGSTAPAAGVAAQPAAVRPAAAHPAPGAPAWINPGAAGPLPVRGGSPHPTPPAGAPLARTRPEAGSAAELSEDAILRNRGDRPRQGWRRALFTVTGGRVNPGIGPVEQARQEQLRRIRRPLPGSHQIAVSSIKGGVGKTSVAACLGLVLAENRGDRVIALDANPDAGTLADRLTSETAVTVRDLIANLGKVHSLTDVARFTTLAGRLQVLASEQDPPMSEAFNRGEYERVCAVLTRFYNIIITDSGTGLVHSAMEGTLALADSLVVVGAPTVDGASRASKTLDWLIAHGHARAVADAVVVLSCDRSSKEVDRGLVRKHFEARCRAVVEVPHDPHLATGGRVELPRLRQPTLDAFLELAALLADGFGAPHAAEAPPHRVPTLS